MVAQQTADRVAVSHAAAQHGGRVRAAVDQISQKVDRVPAGRETDHVQKAGEGGVAALNIANAVKSHGVCGVKGSVDFLLKVLFGFFATGISAAIGY
ncbi:hypothetical protein D3C72_2112160 [compost metagenome]